MRRKDKQSHDESLLQHLLETVTIGHLALIQPDGIPRSVPLNFVSMEGALYFHGARAGEKYQVIATEPQVSFCVVEVLSYISSHYLSGALCEASHFFQSAMIYGTAAICQDPTEKRKALVALLEKYQPEVETNHSLGHDSAGQQGVERTAVFRISIDRWMLKQNLGGYLSAEARKQLKDRLAATGDPLNLRTAALIAEYYE